MPMPQFIEASSPLGEEYCPNPYRALDRRLGGAVSISDVAARAALGSESGLADVASK